MSNYTDTNDFLKKLKIHRADRPSRLATKLMKHRIAHMQEEVDELMQAHVDKDLEGQVDALIDLAYLVMGTANMMGITEEDWHACWNEVHKCNMNKETYTDKTDCKKLGVRKPRGWVAPDFSDVIGAD